MFRIKIKRKRKREMGDGTRVKPNFVEEVRQDTERAATFGLTGRS